MKGFLRVIAISLLLILITSAMAAAYGFISSGFNLRFLYNANFLTGAVIICTALIGLAFPSGIQKPNKLTDHSTFTERHMEQREQKRKKAYGFLLIGIMMIVKTGIVQLVIAAMQ